MQTGCDQVVEELLEQMVPTGSERASVEPAASPPANDELRPRDRRGVEVGLAATVTLRERESSATMSAIGRWTTDGRGHRTMSSEVAADGARLNVRQAAFIGVGAMVGAGIFSLLGAAGEVAGAAVWISFVLAGAVAMLQGYSFAKFGRATRAPAVCSSTSARATATVMSPVLWHGCC